MADEISTDVSIGLVINNQEEALQFFNRIKKYKDDIDSGAVKIQLDQKELKLLETLLKKLQSVSFAKKTDTKIFTNVLTAINKEISTDTFKNLIKKLSGDLEDATEQSIVKGVTKGIKSVSKSQFFKLETDVIAKLTPYASEKRKNDKNESVTRPDLLLSKEIDSLEKEVAKLNNQIKDAENRKNALIETEKSGELNNSGLKTNKQNQKKAQTEINNANKELSAIQSKIDEYKNALNSYEEVSKILNDAVSKKSISGDEIRRLIEIRSQVERDATAIQSQRQLNSVKSSNLQNQYNKASQIQNNRNSISATVGKERSKITANNNELNSVSKYINPGAEWLKNSTDTILSSPTIESERENLITVSNEGLSKILPKLISTQSTETKDKPVETKSPEPAPEKPKEKPTNKSSKKKENKPEEIKPLVSPELKNKSVTPDEIDYPEVIFANLSDELADLISFAFEFASKQQNLEEKDKQYGNPMALSFAQNAIEPLIEKVKQFNESEDVKFDIDFKAFGEQLLNYLELFKAEFSKIGLNQGVKNLEPFKYIPPPDEEEESKPSVTNDTLEDTLLSVKDAWGYSLTNITDELNDAVKNNKAGLSKEDVESYEKNAQNAAIKANNVIQKLAKYPFIKVDTTSDTLVKDPSSNKNIPKKLGTLDSLNVEFFDNFYKIVDAVTALNSTADETVSGTTTEEEEEETIKQQAPASTPVSSTQQQDEYGDKYKSVKETWIVDVPKLQKKFDKALNSNLAGLEQTELDNLKTSIYKLFSDLNNLITKVDDSGLFKVYNSNLYNERRLERKQGVDEKDIPDELLDASSNYEKWVTEIVNAINKLNTKQESIKIKQQNTSATAPSSSKPSAPAASSSPDKSKVSKPEQDDTVDDSAYTKLTAVFTDLVGRLDLAKLNNVLGVTQDRLQVITSSSSIFIQELQGILTVLNKYRQVKLNELSNALYRVGRGRAPSELENLPGMSTHWNDLVSKLEGYISELGTKVETQTPEPEPEPQPVVQAENTSTDASQGQTQTQSNTQSQTQNNTQKKTTTNQKNQTNNKSQSGNTNNNNKDDSNKSFEEKLKSVFGNIDFSKIHFIADLDKDQIEKVLKLYQDKTTSEAAVEVLKAGVVKIVQETRRKIAELNKDANEMRAHADELSGQASLIEKELNKSLRQALTDDEYAAYRQLLADTANLNAEARMASQNREDKLLNDHPTEYWENVKNITANKLIASSASLTKAENEKALLGKDNENVPIINETNSNKVKAAADSAAARRSKQNIEEGLYNDHNKEFLDKLRDTIQTGLVNAQAKLLKEQQALSVLAAKQILQEAIKATSENRVEAQKLRIERDKEHDPSMERYAASKERAAESKERAANLKIENTKLQDISVTEHLNLRQRQRLEKIEADKLFEQQRFEHRKMLKEMGGSVSHFSSIFDLLDGTIFKAIDSIFRPLFSAFDDLKDGIIDLASVFKNSFNEKKDAVYEPVQSIISSNIPTLSNIEDVPELNVEQIEQAPELPVLPQYDPSKLYNFTGVEGQIHDLFDLFNSTIDENYKPDIHYDLGLTTPDILAQAATVDVPEVEKVPQDILDKINDRTQFSRYTDIRSLTDVPYPSPDMVMDGIDHSLTTEEMYSDWLVNSGVTTVGSGIPDVSALDDAITQATESFNRVNEELQDWGKNIWDEGKEWGKNFIVDNVGNFIPLQSGGPETLPPQPKSVSSTESAPFFDKYNLPSDEFVEEHTAPEIAPKQNKFSGIFDSMKEDVSNIFSGVGDKLGKGKGILGDMFKKVGPKLGAAGAAAAPAAALATTAASVTAIFKLGKKFVGFMVNAAKQSEVIQNIFKLITLPLVTLFNLLGAPILKSIVPIIKEAFGWISDNKENIISIGEKIADMINKVFSPDNIVIIDKLMDGLLRVFDWLSDIIVSNLQTIDTSSVPAFIGSLITAIAGMIQDVMIGVTEWLYSANGQALIISVSESVGRLIGTALVLIVEALPILLEVAATTIVGIIEGVIQTIVKQIAPLWDSVDETMGGCLSESANSLIKFYNSMMDLVLSIGKTLGGLLTGSYTFDDALKTLSASIMTTVKELFEMIDNIPVIGNLYDLSGFTDVIGGMIDTINDSKSDNSKTYDNIFDNLTDFLKLEEINMDLPVGERFTDWATREANKLTVSNALSPILGLASGDKDYSDNSKTNSDNTTSTYNYDIKVYGVEDANEFKNFVTSGGIT